MNCLKSRLVLGITFLFVAALSLSGCEKSPVSPSDIDALQAQVDALTARLQDLEPGTGGSDTEKIVFISSATYTGNLNGLNGAHQKCNMLAAIASLPGTYKAWLSDDTGVHTPPRDFITALVPYVRVDGVPIANDWVDLLDGSLAAPINIDENGDATTTSAVWTHTQANGALSAAFHAHAEEALGQMQIQSMKSEWATLRARRASGALCPPLSKRAHRTLRYIASNSKPAGRQWNVSQSTAARQGKGAPNRLTHSRWRSAMAAISLALYRPFPKYVKPPSELC